MNKFRSRLLFALITLIVSVLIGLGVLLGQLFKNFYLDTLNKRIETEARLVALFIESRVNEETPIDEHLKTISDTLSARITVLDNRESILFDTGQISRISDERHKNMLRNILRKKEEHEKGYSFIEEQHDIYYYIVPFYENKQAVGHVILSVPVNSLTTINQQIWGLLIGSLGAALIVILLLGVKITARYTKPIEAATKVAIELAKGNYKARVYEDPQDETSMLSQSINVLARNLQEITRSQEMQKDRLRTLIENMGSGLILIDSRGYINLINRAYKEIFHINPSDYLHRLYYEAFEHKEVIKLVEEIFMTEVKVRKQLLLEVDIERRHFDVYGAPIIGTNDEWRGIVLVFHDITELKKLEQMRKDFVANVSHELKTPITSIKGFTETLLDGAMHNEETLEYFLSIILKESDRLQSLIHDLLELSKIEQHGFELELQTINIVQMLKEIIIILQGKAEAKEIILESLSEKDVFIQGDLNRLKQVFINLINNAIAYTPKGGKVQAIIEEKNDEVLVHIKDTGIGIEEKEIPRIFERFYRIDKARSRNSGGTGLGLAIVKHLVEAHHGYITVKSKVGKGTTFTVHFLKES